ncbi:MAG: histidine kinase [Pseudomonadota bacterium]
MPLVIPKNWRFDVTTLKRDIRLALLVALGGAFIIVLSTNGAPELSTTQFLRAILFYWSMEILIITPMLLGISYGYQLLPDSGVARALGMLLLCLLVGSGGLALRSFSPGWTLGDDPSKATAIALMYWNWHVVLSALFLTLREFTGRNDKAARALHEAQLQQIVLEREVIQARLQVLHAQIEPHFLFNSLANVRCLMRSDAATSHALLSDLLRYLEEALPRFREERTTLGSEVELVRAFLAVHQVRMGQRLCVEFDVPAALQQQQVPPLTLLTLVENALKHGLQPLPEGGTIRVAARSAGGMIALTVSDTGCGMGCGSGAGTGLVNLRARLKAMYGALASLSLRINEPRGVIATIALPEAMP